MKRCEFRGKLELYDEFNNCLIYIIIFFNLLGVLNKVLEGYIFLNLYFNLVVKWCIWDVIIGVMVLKVVNVEFLFYVKLWLDNVLD